MPGDEHRQQQPTAFALRSENLEKTIAGSFSVERLVRQLMGTVRVHSYLSTRSLNDLIAAGILNSQGKILVFYY